MKLEHNIEFASDKYFLPIWKKYVLLQSISEGNHEALYLRLANGNLRNFYEKQEWYDGFARISVGCFHFFFSRYSQDLHSGKWYAAPRFRL